MARPKKYNADYFTHDADMRNDPKIKALRKKHSFQGYAIWCFLLESLTDSDNFEIEWNDLNIELLSGDFDCQTEDLKNIVDYCIKVNLLEIVDGKLLCYQLKERFESLLSKRKRDMERILASENKSQVVFDSENTHSKVKYSKVENSKVENEKEIYKENFNKINGNDIDLFMPAFELSKETEFEDSLAFDTNIWNNKLRKEAALGVDLEYYKQVILDWNNTIRIKDKRKKRTAKGWIATARTFMREDNKKNKLKMVVTDTEKFDEAARYFLSL